MTENNFGIGEREIKFRAFDRADGIHNDEDIMSYGCRPDCDADCIMQYTGLKDKNGKEIYEGDIIKKSFSDKPYSKTMKFKERKMVVIYYTHNISNNDHNNSILKKDPSAFNTNPMFVGKHIDIDYKYGCCNWSEFAECEVIGNIFDNPELLK